MARELTDKQRVFVTEYLKCFNATEAASRAGYTGTYESLRVIGSQNLTKPAIREAIQEFLDQSAMSASEVLYHLTEIARADIGDVVDERGNFNMRLAREKQRTRLIRKIKNKSYTTEEADVSEQEIEMYDRLRALDILAKYHNLTTSVRLDDWRTDAIGMIRRGELTYEALAEAFNDTSLAAELFAAAGIPVQVGEGEGAE